MSYCLNCYCKLGDTMSNGEEKKTEQPQGTIQITISAGDGVQGQMAGQLIFDQDSSFITDLLEMADRTVHGPIPIGQSEEIIEPPKPSPRYLHHQAITSSRYGQPVEALYAGQDYGRNGPTDDYRCRPDGGCGYYSNNADPSANGFYDELETGPESCVVTPRQSLTRTIDGKERMTAGFETRMEDNQTMEIQEIRPDDPDLVQIGGKERLAAGGEMRRYENFHHNIPVHYQPRMYYGKEATAPMQQYAIPNQPQNQDRLTSGYCYCNPALPTPCGFGDCSNTPYGFCRTQAPQAAPEAANGGFDPGAHNENMRALTQNTQSNLSFLRKNLSCVANENVNYVWDSAYSCYTVPWDSYDKHHYNTSDRVYFEQKVCPEPPCEKDKKPPPCPVHPEGCPIAAPCPTHEKPPCPIDLCGMVVTREAFTRNKKEQRFDTGMTGCAEMRSTEEDNFRRSVIPQTEPLPDSLSFKENKILQFACGQEQMQGEELYSNNKLNHYFGRSTTYGNCFEKKSCEDRTLARRLGCPISLIKPSYGMRTCDMEPLRWGNDATGPNTWTNDWDTKFPKEEIFLHHLQDYETEQNNVGFSEVLNDQKEFKRSSRPVKMAPGPCDPPETCDYGPTNPEPCAHRTCAGADEATCKRETADKGCVEPEEEKEEGEEEEEEQIPTGGSNKFDPCSGQGNAFINKNFRTRRVDRDCTGTTEMLQTELDQEFSHTTCWGGSVYAATGQQPKRSNIFDRMCVA